MYLAAVSAFNIPCTYIYYFVLFYSLKLTFGIFPHRFMNHVIGELHFKYVL